MKHKAVLALIGFCLLSPVISFTIRQAIAEDSTHVVTPTTPMLQPLVYQLDIEGAIGAVTDTRISDALDDAEESRAELVVIMLDTPGGFTKPTWSICKHILNSPVPVCIYIAPSGARAGSAGVYMTYAAHFAAMAPSTNIGAAHPVSGEGQKVDSIMNEKITNDAVAQIKAAADKRGRNAAWAERAVRESVSITDKEALDSNVINIRAENLDDLLRQLDGRETETPFGKKTLKLAGARVETMKHSFVQKVLEIITSPDVAFILFSIGGLGIVLELYNPGSILPGVVGAICLILAFYSFQTLPINYAGVLLILLAIILFIVEIKVVSHGLLTVGGIVSLILGGLMLVDTVDPALRVSWSVLITTGILLGLTLVLVGTLVYRASRSKPFIGQHALVGKHGEIHPEQFVYVEGALWKYESDQPLDIGAKVEIISVDQLTLKVRKLNS
ncbi:MAG: nodulation protein NfeD [Candidatus Zixiibacteriota bacterium]